jgi:hypothetical protein
MRIAINKKIKAATFKSFQLRQFGGLHEVDALLGSVQSGRNRMGTRGFGPRSTGVTYVKSSPFGSSLQHIWSRSY